MTELRSCLNKSEDHIHFQGPSTATSMGPSLSIAFISTGE
jgi:hypothetical protein